MESGGLLQHGADGTVLFFGQVNCLFDRGRIDVEAANYVMNANGREDLGRALRLVGFDAYVVTGDFLVILLAQNCDDVEGSTSRQSGGHEFDGFGPGSSGAIVEQQAVFASGFRHKLSLLSERLREFDFRGNHGFSFGAPRGSHMN